MGEHVYYILVAAILVAMLPLVPKMIALRTRVLYALHLKSLACWHERNSGTLVVVVRLILATIAAVLVVLAFASMQ